MSTIRMTVHTRLVLLLFGQDPQRERYGLEVAQRLSMRAGTVYPILDRLTRAGWLVRRWEEVEAVWDRPRRRLYRMTSEAARLTPELEVPRYVAELAVAPQRQRPPRKPEPDGRAASRPAVDSLLWRWVRDRKGSPFHAIPADFEVPTWYSVCLEKIAALAAQQWTPQGHTFSRCLQCQVYLRQLEADDRADHRADNGPTPAQLRVEFDNGASLTGLQVRYGLSERVIRSRLRVAGAVFRGRGNGGNAGADVVIRAG